jgi:hypothetical protein
MTSSGAANQRAAATADFKLDGRASDRPVAVADQHGTRALIPRRWLTPARIAWVVLALLGAVIFVMDFRRNSALLLTVTPEYASGLAALGLSVSAFRTAIDSIQILTMLAFSAVGILIFWRRSEEWVGFVGSLTLVTFGVAPSFLKFGVRVPGMWSPLSALMLALGTALTITIFFIFPDGRFFPRWTAGAAIATWVWAVTWPVFPALNAFNWPLERLPVVSVLYVTATVALVYRYRRTVDAQQRQQMKWIMYSFALAVVIWAIAEGPRLALQPALSPQAYSLATLASAVLIMLVQLLIPLAFAVAILRYRLFDIDLIINRTLVYVPLTGILAGVYAASIALFQRVFQAFTGQKSDAAVVVTTLLLVAVFSPLKDALQHLVDRRYRDGRDPTAPLEAFARHVRSIADVFDPLRITEQALETAAAALGAPGGAIYVERAGELRLFHTCGEWPTGEIALDVALEAEGNRAGCLQLAARRDGKVYGERDRRILREAMAEVGRVLHLADTGHRLTDSESV